MLVLDSSFVLKKHGAKQNRISWANTWSLGSDFFVAISLFWGWCHCALCLRLGGASVSIGCLPLLPAGGSGQAWIGHRWWAAGPQMFGLFGWIKLGENLARGDETWVIMLGEHVSMDLSVVKIGQSKMCFCRLDINFCMFFVKPKGQRSTLELPSSVLPREALTLLYIGGASSSSSLLSCQETDGANEARMGRASMQ